MNANERIMDRANKFKKRKDGLKPCDWCGELGDLYSMYTRNKKNGGFSYEMNQILVCKSCCSLMNNTTLYCPKLETVMPGCPFLSCKRADCIRNEIVYHLPKRVKIEDFIKIPGFPAPAPVGHEIMHDPA